MNVLKGIPAVVWAALVVLLTFVGGYATGCGKADARWTARLQAVAQHADSTEKRLRDSLLVSGERLRVDTVNLTKWKTRWDTLRVQGATIYRPGDGIPYPVYVEVVKTADSTIQACSLALLDCGKRGVLLEQANAQLTLQRDAYHVLSLKKPPSRTRWLVVGAVLGAVTYRFLLPPK